jgi:phage I-like protein
VSIPVDLDHSTVKKAAMGESAPAVGWIDELQARADGLWGRVTWLKEGLRVLAEKTHRYISPALQPDKSGTAVWIHSAALVAAPALSMPAIASVDVSTKGQDAMLDPKIAEALGLDTNASADEIATKIMALSAKAEGTDAIIAGLGGVIQKLSGQVVTARNKRIDDRVNRAISEGSATPALRDFCLTLANTDENLLEEFCAKIGTPWAYLRTSAITPEQERAVQFSRTELPITMNSDAGRLATQLGIDIKALE